MLAFDVWDLDGFSFYVVWSNWNFAKFEIPHLIFFDNGFIICLSVGHRLKLWHIFLFLILLFISSASIWWTMTIITFFCILCRIYQICFSEKNLSFYFAREGKLLITYEARRWQLMYDELALGGQVSLYFWLWSIIFHLGIHI